MAKVKTEKRGRKPLPASVKKVPIRIMVMGKFKKFAQAECNVIAEKYN